MAPYVPLLLLTPSHLHHHGLDTVTVVGARKDTSEHPSLGVTADTRGARVQPAHRDEAAGGEKDGIHARHRNELPRAGSVAELLAVDVEPQGQQSKAGVSTRVPRTY